MDVRYINPFIKSVSNTLGMMCQLETKFGKPKLKTENDPLTDVSGIIGFSGDAAGSVVLCLSFETASRIASRFAGVELLPEDPDFADAIGELANMVAGGAKGQFEGLDISVSLPNVIIGHRHSVLPSKTSPRIVIPCTTELGTFQVEIGMKINTPTRIASTPITAGGQA